MEPKKGLSPTGLALCGLGICAFTGVTWLSRGYPNTLDFWLIGVGTVIMLAGIIIAAVRR